MIAMRRSRDGDIVIGDSKAMGMEMMFKREDSSLDFSLNRTYLFSKTQNYQVSQNLKRLENWWYLSKQKF